MKVRIENLIKHLRTQLAVAKQLDDSQWVYITKNEAEKCLELAQAEETLLSAPVHTELEGGGHSWWYVCGECHGAIDNSDLYCRHCGRKCKWDGLPH